MNDKQGYEAYRVRQFSGPHPALQVATEAANTTNTSDVQPTTEQLDSNVSMDNAFEQQRRVTATATMSSAADPLGVQLPADQYRVIVHFDVDAFYSQVEEVRNPSLRGRPLAVTQKYLVVTCNYPARQDGVTKLMNIADAKRACPGLVLVPGEDLTPYRHASRDIRAVLSRWGPTEKLGLDECWVDITQEVNLRMASSSSNVPPLTEWPCHLATAAVSLTADSKHRPQDLRATSVASSAPAAAAVAQSKLQPTGLTAIEDRSDDGVHPTVDGDDHTAVGSGGGGLPGDGGAVSDDAAAWRARLYHGCRIAADMKTAVAAETQYRCSAGVAFNKLLSKLVSGLHKPNGQTAITPAAAAAFIAPLPVRALPGVGYKSESTLKAWGVSTVADVRAMPKEKLVQLLGDKTGDLLMWGNTAVAEAYLFDGC
eukprot:GHUV01021245.1.p1 GENE.GHUV01021245.1~~GHUV01021245.1.p1  ORF type:complete len:426 (+),score=135.49 GHUV01021245.1:409-1686(+)